MAEKRPAYDSIDAYIRAFPEQARLKMQELRELIRSVVPEASETISYAIPTFDYQGRHLVHFAAYARHIGFYPTSSGTGVFQAELAAYKTSKGAVQFPIDQPLPIDLIRRIVAFRAEENRQRHSARIG